jgi:hypothetical protein
MLLSLRPTTYLASFSDKEGGAKDFRRARALEEDAAAVGDDPAALRAHGHSRRALSTEPVPARWMQNASQGRKVEALPCVTVRYQIFALCPIRRRAYQNK